MTESDVSRRGIESAIRGAVIPKRVADFWLHMTAEGSE